MFTAPNLIPQGEQYLLLICRIDLEIIQEAGKGFRWKKPERCPSCRGTRLWGHGYVLRYFFGFTRGLWMKRWRCPECASVHTVRPEPFSPGVHYPRSVQLDSLEAKLTGKPFLNTISRQVQQHWHKIFRVLCARWENWPDARTFFDTVVVTGQLAVTKKRIYRENRPHSRHPYLPFALTIKPPYVSLE